MIKTIAADFEKFLEDLFETCDTKGEILEASKYMVLNQGKRIRPLCFLSLIRDFGHNPEDFFNQAAALELVHSASLIHDDLPSIDNDEIRRGKPSCHIKFSEAVAILTGDYLQALSFTVITRGNISDACKVKLSNKLADAFSKICQGQVLDMRVGPAENLNVVHALKTAALFRAALAFAPISLGSAKNIVASLDDLGEAFGMYFQLLDDYLDIYAQSSSFTRPYSSDTRNQKVTLFTLGKFSLKEANSIVIKTRERVEKKITESEKTCGVKFDNFMQIIHLINQRIN